MKYLLFLFVMISIALCGCSGANRGENTLNAAVRALEKGRNERSLRLFRKAIDLPLSRRQEALAHNGAGLALWRLGEHELAELAFATGMDMDPDLADPLYNMGVIKAEQKKWPDAIAYFEKSALLEDKDSRALEYLSYVHRRAGNPEEAGRALNEALSRAPHSPRLLAARAALDFESGEVKKAVSGFQLALEHDAAYSPAIYNMGVIFKQSLSDSDQAEAYFQEYLRLSPDGQYAEQARQALQDIRHREEHVLVAEREEADPAPIPPDDVETEVSVEKIPTEMPVEELFPESPAYEEYMRIAGALEQQGRLKASVHNFLRAAVIAERAGESQQQKRAMNNAIKAAAEDERAHYALGSYFLERNRNAEAKKHLDMAIAPDENWAAPYIALAGLLAEEGELDAAVVCLRQADSAEPDKPDALWLLANLYDRRMGLEEQAVQCYTGFIRRFPDDPRVSRALEQLLALNNSDIQLNNR